MIYRCKSYYHVYGVKKGDKIIAGSGAVVTKEVP